jgi:hypothetical protein
MKQVRHYVEKAEPDVIIEVDSDHFVNFFYNNLPSFCIGMAEEAHGPQEIWCPMPRYREQRPGHVEIDDGAGYAVWKFDWVKERDERLSYQ